MNKLLLRQINKHIGNTTEIPEKVQKLLNIVSEAYDHYEKDRKMLERSIEISSTEMKELNSRLRKETEVDTKAVYEQLKESLLLLNEDNEQVVPVDLDYQKLSQIAEILTNETRKRRIAEREGSQRTAHLEASQKIAHIGSWELDLSKISELNTAPIYWSDETYRIFGYEPGSINVTNDTFFECIPQEDAFLVQEAMKQALQTNGIYDIEHRIVLPDSSEKIVHERAEIIINKTTSKQLKMVGTIQDITNKKKTEQQLRKANYELKTLFENMQECIFTVDATTYQLIQISISCEEIYGYTVEEFMQNHNLWIEVVFEEDRAEIWARNADLAKGESIVNIYRIRDRKNNIKWLETKIKPRLDKEGKLIRLYGVTSDITKRKEAEIALINSEHRFRSLIENSSDATVVIDENFNVIFASDSLYRVTGFTPDEVIGLSNSDFVHNEDTTIAEEFLKDILLSPGKVGNIVYRLKRKDGKLIWTERIATNLIHDPIIQGIVINFRDITERKEVENSLKESELKFRSLIENSSDVISVMDEESRFIYTSDSIYRITGFKPEELEGKTSIDFVHPDDRQLLHEGMKKILDNPNDIAVARYRRIKKDGSYIWCEGTASNLLYEPAVKGVVVNFRDISERVEYENALQASNIELKKTNSELDKFVYSVSHDLRAPLSSMLGVISLVESETTDKTIAADIKLIKNSINKLDGFIGDILDYSRNSRMEIKAQEIEFHEVLDDIRNNLKHMASANSNVDIQVNINNEHPFFSDKTRVNIILNNLISNAIRYSNPKTTNSFVKVTIDTSETVARITIKDNGVGIAKENQDKIFDMFYRVSKNSVGSGLGLYIVKETIEKLHGTMQLESALEEGTEFIAVLPNLINVT